MSFLRRLCLHNLEFNPQPGYVVASLDRTLYDNFLCFGGFEKVAKFSGQDFKEIQTNIALLETPKQVRIWPSTKLLLQ